MWGPLSLVSTIEEILGSNSIGSGLENREYVCGDQLRYLPDNICQQKLALTSSARSGCSVRLRTKAKEFLVPLYFTIASLLGFALRKAIQLRIYKAEEGICMYEYRFFFLKSKFILQSVVIHLAECYGEGILQCLGERPSVEPLHR
jgi:hypothetical protein